MEEFRHYEKISLFLVLFGSLLMFFAFWLSTLTAKKYELRDPRIYEITYYPQQVWANVIFIIGMIGAFLGLVLFLLLFLSKT